MNAESPTHVVTWRETDMPDEITKVRVASLSRPRDFIDRSRGIAFRINTTDHPEEFFAPRHRHTFDQVRYMIFGSCRYGKTVYQEGDFMYLPAGGWYGPMRLSESGENYKHFQIQFQGLAQRPYYPPTEFDDVREKLLKQGKFEHGVFVWNDGRKQDAYEALLEGKTGQPVVYPEPPIESYTVVRSRHIAWRDLGDGIAIKHLGHFSEVGPNAQLVKMAAGARTPGGIVPYQQVRCLVQGKVRFDDEPGEVYEPYTMRYVPPATRYGGTECIEEAVFCVVRWAPDGQLYSPAAEEI